MSVDGEMSPAVVDQMIVWGRGSRLASLADPGQLLFESLISSLKHFRSAGHSFGPEFIRRCSKIPICNSMHESEKGAETA